MPASTVPTPTLYQQRKQQTKLSSSHHQKSIFLAYNLHNDRNVNNHDRTSNDNNTTITKNQQVTQTSEKNAPLGSKDGKSLV